MHLLNFMQKWLFLSISRSIIQQPCHALILIWWHYLCDFAYHLFRGVFLHLDESLAFCLIAKWLFPL